ncbi:hypothetical protein QZM82_33765, partial [Burkholderia cepacia]|nr:hypothetical protein [Burkholderia cepacia]
HTRASTSHSETTTGASSLPFYLVPRTSFMLLIAPSIYVLTLRRGSVRSIDRPYPDFLNSAQKDLHMFMSDTQVLRTYLVAATVEQARKVGFEESFRSLVTQWFHDMSDADVRAMARIIV